MTGSSGFDRVRARSGAAPQPSAPRPVDREGKQALYSIAAAPPTVGGVALTCRACGQRTVVGWWQAARLAVPGLLVPVPGRSRAWMRCPACRGHGWVDLDLRA